MLVFLFAFNFCDISCAFFFYSFSFVSARRQSHCFRVHNLTKAQFYCDSETYLWLRFVWGSCWLSFGLKEEKKKLWFWKVSIFFRHRKLDYVKVVKVEEEKKNVFTLYNKELPRRRFRLEFRSSPLRSPKHFLEPLSSVLRNRTQPSNQNFQRLFLPRGFISKAAYKKKTKCVSDFSSIWFRSFLLSYLVSCFICFSIKSTY